MDPITKKPGRPRDESLVARRQDEILRVATGVFAEQGYHRTDLQAVADRIGVGKGTIYRYFETKEALFLAAVDRGMRGLKARVDGAVAAIEDPLTQFAAAVRAYLAYFDAHAELIELIIQERAQFKDRKQPTYFEHRDANIGRWRALFQRLMRDGRVRRMPVEVILDGVSDLLYGAIFTNHFAGRRKPFEKQASEILDLVFQGILSEEGRRAARMSRGASGNGARRPGEGE